MSKFLVVLPVISEHTTAKCINSLWDIEGGVESAAGFYGEDVLVVDNSRDGFAKVYEPLGVTVHRDPNGHNLGVARSWNVGARKAIEEGLDYLVLMSASMQFGPILHTTWVRQMEAFWGENVIEADGHSWHLIAFHRRVFEAVGLFDENFYPAYFEAIDFGYRMRQVGMEGGWRRVWVNALSQGSAMHNHVVSCPAPPLLQYYRDKWGGDKGHETYVKPFGGAPLDYWPINSIPDLARKYDLEVWW